MKRGGGACCYGERRARDSNGAATDLAGERGAAVSARHSRAPAARHAAIGEPQVCEAWVPLPDDIPRYVPLHPPAAGDSTRGRAHGPARSVAALGESAVQPRERDLLFRAARLRRHLVRHVQAPTHLSGGFFLLRAGRTLQGAHELVHGAHADDGLLRRTAP